MPLGTCYQGPKDFLKSSRPTILTTDLDASVREYIDCAGFKLVQRIAHTAALLERDGVLVQLLRRYVQYEKNIYAAAGPSKQPAQRIAVESIFNLYNSLAKHLIHKLSGPPLLSLLGTWEFSMTDSQNNTLFFVQYAVNGVFTWAPQSSAGITAK